MLVEVEVCDILKFISSLDLFPGGKRSEKILFERKSNFPFSH